MLNEMRSRKTADHVKVETIIFVGRGFSYSSKWNVVKEIPSLIGPRNSVISLDLFPGVYLGT